jgi:NadR type nicotinamide-nucleotide adenylyltransferase
MADGNAPLIVRAWSGSYPYDDPYPPPEDPPPPERTPETEPVDPPNEPPRDPERGDAHRGVGTGSGLACGRFMPLHTGHEHYIHFAREWVHDLTVILFSYPGDPIPGELREQWLHETFPSVKVLHATVAPPAREARDFWLQWAKILQRLLPSPPDFLFTGDIRAAHIAKHLGATHVLVDAKREAVPISATRIRERPLAHWRFLPPAVRPYYVKRVSLLGPESTGKTTLARRLADHFQTTLVPEYARQAAETRGRLFGARDVETIARAQIAAEASLSRAANRVLVCDTDARAVRMWSERLFDRCPPWIVEAATKRRYDLTLVTAPDVPFVGQAALDQPEMRRAFHARSVEEARATSDRVILVSGSWEDRWATARAAVEALLEE